MSKINKSNNNTTNEKKLRIDIDNGPSRLRKLKKSEKEKTIDGFQYEQRLKEQYSKIIGKSEVFNWADPSKNKQAHTGLEEAEDAEGEDEDLISKLLKTNTTIFQNHTS